MKGETQLGASTDAIHRASTMEIAAEGGSLSKYQRELVQRSLEGSLLSSFELLSLAKELRGHRRGDRWLIPLAIVGMGAVFATALLAYHGFDELALEGVTPGNSFGATLLLATICVGAFGFVVIEFCTLVLLFRSVGEQGIEHELELNLQSTEEEEEPKRSWLARLFCLLPGIHRGD